MINRVKEELGDLSVWTWLFLVLGLWQFLDLVEMAGKALLGWIGPCV